MGRVLIAEDDPVALGLLSEVLQGRGHDVVRADSAEEALERAAGFEPQVVVTDVRMGPMDGVDLLHRLRARDARVQIVVVTAFGSLATAVDAIRGGAFDYLSKPFGMDEMCAVVDRALEAWGSVPTGTEEGPVEVRELLGRSPAMTRVFKDVARASPLRAAVLIQGETGTGKELVARAIHDASDRAEGPYVTVSCPSLPEGLLESELFGHVRGAFTGASGEHRGLFRAASGGTLLLDEIGDMPLAIQAKLLRVLETSEVRSVGASSAEQVDVRVLAATHRDLERCVEEGTFRQDLLYRLNTITITLPPLRERLEDLELLCTHFLALHAGGAGTRHELTPAALAALRAYAWPGNVRELSHVLERAVALAAGPRVDVEDLPAQVRDPVGTAPAPSPQRLADVERAHILSVLDSVGGKRARAAGLLGIDRKTLYRKLLRYGIATEGEDPAEE
jgi:two-component system response regulator AtoC